MPVITHLIFNLRLLNFTEKLQPILFLPFEISADSNGKHLGTNSTNFGWFLSGHLSKLYQKALSLFKMVAITKNRNFF
jgi:hypothetical protein